MSAYPSCPTLRPGEAATRLVTRATDPKPAARYLRTGECRAGGHWAKEPICRRFAKHICHERRMTSSLETVRTRLEDQFRARTPQTRKLHERSQHRSPHPGAGLYPYPLTYGRGSGSRLFDVDRNEYLDLGNSNGRLVHGHAHPRIAVVVAERISKGLGHGDAVDVAVELAELLSERFASMQTVRFVNSRTEAVMMAIRAARAFTGRRKILKMEGGYHGSYDSVSVSVDPGPNGLPWPIGWPEGGGLSSHLTSEALVAPFNNQDAIRMLITRHADELAAVIIEPMLVSAGMIPAEPDFIQEIRAVTREHGVLLIVDEADSFRLSPGGGQELYSTDADLTTLGDALGGELPIGAFGGRPDVMQSFDAQWGATRGACVYDPCAVSLNAALATLRVLTPERIEHTNALGDHLRSRLRRLLDGADIPAQVTGTGSLGQIHFSSQPVRDYRSAASGRREMNRLLHLAVLNRGIATSLACGFAISTCTEKDDIDRAASVFDAVLEDIGSTIRSAILDGRATPEADTGADKQGSASDPPAIGEIDPTHEPRPSHPRIFVQRI